MKLRICENKTHEHFPINSKVPSVFLSQYFDSLLSSSDLSLVLLISFAISFNPDQDRQKVGPDPDLKHVTSDIFTFSKHFLIIVFVNEFLKT